MRFRLLLELALLRHPIRSEGGGNHHLELAACIAAAVHLQVDLGQKKTRGNAVGRVPQRLLQVLDGFGIAAAEESRHSGVPTTQGAIRASFQVSRVDGEGLLERRLDRASISQAGPQPEPFGHPTHVGRGPEVAFRSIGSRRGCCPSRRDPLLESGAPLCCGHMASEPVTRPGKLPGGLEISRIPGDTLRPEFCRRESAREILAFRIQGLGFRIGRCDRALEHGPHRAATPAPGEEKNSDRRRPHENILRPERRLVKPDTSELRPGLFLDLFLP
jgi:hypothetical protein